jgi:hypothetical protein
MLRTQHELLQLTIISFLIMFACCTQSSQKKEPISETHMQVPEKLWYFEMDSVQIENLFGSLKAVSLGDTASHVIAILGPPTSDQVSTRKENNEFLNRTVDYYVRRRDKELVNLNDQILTLVFDVTNRLIKIESNVPGHILDVGPL